MGDQTDLNSIEQAGLYVIDDTTIEPNNVETTTEFSVAPKRRSAKRKRRLRSAVWGYFELLPSGKDGRQRCKCRTCGTSYLYDSKFGTGNMKRHLKTCWKREAQDLDQLPTQYDSSLMPCSTPKFDHEKFKEILMEAILMHDLPFQIVEWVGFRDLLLYLCPDLQLVTRKTMVADCMEVYRREKAKVQAILQGTSSRISLTYDLWSSLNTDDYICLTAYFIDNDWNLQKKVLNFCLMPHHGTSLAEKIHDFLVDWGIDDKISTITMRSALTNAFPVELLKGQLNSSQGFLLDAEYFHLQCCVHTIELIAQEGLKEIAISLHKIRESIKYIKGSQTGERIFLYCVTHCSLDDKHGLRQDVPSWWSSTFVMLDSALFYRQAFIHLELSDSNYKDGLSESEWNKIEKIGKLLAVFYNIHCVFSITKFPTANLYFPAIFSAYLTLQEEMESDDDWLKALVSRMLSLLEKYWSSFSMILAIAVILDPRYKFSFVEWCYKKLYGDGGVLKSMKVKEKLCFLFSKYASAPNLLPGPKTVSVAKNRSDKGWFKASEVSFSRVTDDFFKEFDSLANEEVVLQKSQLELYLDEPRIDRKFKLDILSYWKSNQFRFPEVAAMARDILCIPFSTDAGESAFDENDRVLDQCESALHPDILEAFICTRDWLYGENDTTKLMLEELTKNIFQLNVKDKVDLPG